MPMATILETLAIAIQHLEAGRFQAVEQICQHILAQKPDQADTIHLLGVLAYQTHHYESAAEQIGRAITLRPTEAAFYTSLGNVFQAQRKPDEAIACFRQSLALQPEHAETYNNLGMALYEQGQLGEAAVAFRSALQRKPTLAQAHNNLGNALQGQRKHSAAVDCYRRALELNPADAPAHSNLANALRQLGRFDEALTNYARALELRPDYATAHCGRAMLRLLVGDFETGWSEYEWRWKTRQAHEREFSKPRWEGLPLGNATILVHDEQGFGDTFQFVRFASLVKNLNPSATVIVECQQSLLKVLASCPGVDRIIPRGDDLPPFDYQVPLLSLPAIFRTTPRTIPATVPYLSPDPALVALWRERLRPLNGFRVGINWHGRPGTLDFSRRNLPLEEFSAVGAIPGVDLVSLQIGEGREQLPAAIHNGLPIVDLGDDFDADRGPFMDTVAVMMNLDLVITSDTSIPHLAGALGVPVWLALPTIPDWRWLLGRDDSPWYPTMRIFRQTVAGDWSEVLAQMVAELHNVLTFAR
jgi:Tfp pilus assembly protein PilF